MRRELPAWSALALMGWLTVVLWLDRAGGGGGLWQQRGLGLATWLVLLVALSRVSPTVRAQTAVVVAFATVVEYVFSPTLEVYTYRFDNVPAFVPPGHGLVYLSAFALGHAAFVERHRRTAISPVLALGGVWAAYGVLVADRTDVLGCVLVRVPGRVHAPRARRRRSTSARSSAVSWLEVVGTHLGTWRVGDPRPDRLGADRQPAVGRGRRLRLVRPGGAARRAAPAAGPGPVHSSTGSADGRLPEAADVR